MRKSIDYNSIKIDERVFALDALKGIMMLLGIILHTASSYSLKSDWGHWPIKDPDNNFLFFVLVEYIHTFRMPVFFIVSGFFAAMLYYKKGSKALLKNRFHRIVLPFIGCVFLLLPFIKITMDYSLASIKANSDPFQAAWQTAKNLPIIPKKMAHLWFLYFLIFFSFGSWLLAIIFRNNIAWKFIINKIITFIIKNFWLRLITIMAFYFLMLVCMGTTGIITSNWWIPNMLVLLLYFMFFNLGWIIYKTGSLHLLKRCAVPQLTIATIFFFIGKYISFGDEYGSHAIKQLLTALSGTLFIFGFIAFFLTFFHSYSRRLNYLMEASYWVYLIHLPFTQFIPSILAHSGISVYLKFIITLSVTSIISILSYKYFVRGTFIGKFLNGKIHKSL